MYRAAVALITALALFPGTAAASRVVVTASEPVQWAIDGVVLPACVGTTRCAIPHVQAGIRVLTVQDLSGRPLHSERLVVADGSDVRVQWSRGEPFVLLGARTDKAAVPEAVVSETRPAPNASNGATASHSMESRGVRGLRDAAGRPPSVGQVASAVTGAGVAGVAAGAASSGIRSLTHGAKAGTSFGTAPAPPQRVVRPNIVVGAVTFIKPSGDAVVIYEDGMIVAQLGAGAAEQTVRLEVGRRAIEVRSGTDHRLLFSGDLTVRQEAGVRLEVSESSPPVALDQGWLFKPL